MNAEQINAALQPLAASIAQSLGAMRTQQDFAAAAVNLRSGLDAAVKAGAAGTETLTLAATAFAARLSRLNEAAARRDRAGVRVTAGGPDRIDAERAAAHADFVQKVGQMAGEQAGGLVSAAALAAAAVVALKGAAAALKAAEDRAAAAEQRAAALAKPSQPSPMQRGAAGQPAYRL